MANRNPVGTKGKSWKRGARAGNYTALQWNVACRVKNGFGEEGCSYGDQARISLGAKARGECSTRYGFSECSGVTGPT